ncbi:LOW QUALITY PROTEIN: hypothetical protein QTO34_001255, partial [Cnephaeus nilssonii]
MADRPPRVPPPSLPPPNRGRSGVMLPVVNVGLLLGVLLSFSINCSGNFTLPYNNGHPKLLAGWFLICGVAVYSHWSIAANSTRGPCSLERLTIFMLQKHRWVRTKRNLLTAVAPTAMMISTCGVLQNILLYPFFFYAGNGSLNVEVTQLACGMVKALNATSRAIQGINQELSQILEAQCTNFRIRTLAGSLSVTCRDWAKTGSPVPPAAPAFHSRSSWPRCACCGLAPSQSRSGEARAATAVLASHEPCIWHPVYNSQDLETAQVSISRR